MKAYMIWNGGPTMELIDRVFIMKELTSSEGQAAIKAMTGAEAYNHFLTLACSAPAIDPIRAAGGCRCGECKHWESIEGSNDYCARHETFCSKFCGDGEPMEARDDG